MGLLGCAPHFENGRVIPAIFLPANHHSVCRQIDQQAFAPGRTETLS